MHVFFFRYWKRQLRPGLWWMLMNLVRPTGLHRTYPHLMACEATRGNESNAWSKGNSPEHECILPFTRALGGPITHKG